MKSFFTVFAFALLGVSIAAKCGDNEQLKKCGTACEPSCTNPNPVESAILFPKHWLPLPDLPSRLRSERLSVLPWIRPQLIWKCVRRTQCSAPPKCKTNETFQTCGTACEPSCRNPNPESCTEQCIVSVCQCSKGFVRDQSGKCVLQSECTAQCGVNEVFKACGTPCEPSCKTPNPTCPAVCVPDVCQCAPGFVRDSSNKCVSCDSCSSAPKCGVNEVFTTCGTPCEPSCKTPNPICMAVCVPDVCQCARGFVRGPSGCIEKKQC